MGCVFVYKFETMFGTVKTWKERSLGGNYEGSDGWWAGGWGNVSNKCRVAHLWMYAIALKFS